MTVKELLELYAGKYDSFELFSKADYRWHTDSLSRDFEPDSTGDLDGFECEYCEVQNYEIMTPEEYNHSVLANADWSLTPNQHGNILLILINKDIRG